MDEWEAASVIASRNDEITKLRAENKLLREALDDIVNASRDDGLAAMCNWMRGRAAAALGPESG
jgi:hypothetical protein